MLSPSTRWHRSRGFSSSSGLRTHGAGDDRRRRGPGELRHHPGDPNVENRWGGRRGRVERCQIGIQQLLAARASKAGRRAHPLNPQGRRRAPFGAFESESRNSIPVGNNDGDNACCAKIVFHRAPPRECLCERLGVGEERRRHDFRAATDRRPQGHSGERPRFDGRRRRCQRRRRDGLRRRLRCGPGKLGRARCADGGPRRGRGDGRRLRAVGRAATGGRRHCEGEPSHGDGAGDGKDHRGQSHRAADGWLGPRQPARGDELTASAARRHDLALRGPR